jgi:hypothetical protein
MPEANAGGRAAPAAEQRSKVGGGRGRTLKISLLLRFVSLGSWGSSPCSSELG